MLGKIWRQPCSVSLSRTSSQFHRRKAKDYSLE